MSYPYGGGYGYPPAGGGYPGQGAPQPGYPQQPGMPMPHGGGPGYPGGLPYAPQPTGGPGGIGFQAVASQSGFPQGPPMPTPGAPPQAGFGGGYPPPSQPGYPTGGGYQQPPPPASYQPPPGGVPYGQPPQASGYPQAGGQPGYPSSGGQPGYPQASGQPYPQAAGQSYPQATGQPRPGYQQPGQPTVQAAYSTPTPSAPGGMIPTTHMHTVGMQAREQGTVTEYRGFNAETDAQTLRKAMKGLGTDEKAIIDILGYRTNAQRQKIKLQFKTMFGRDLIKDLQSELGGKFEDAVMALMMPPAEYDAMELRNAMQGLGTDEACLIEILATRNNAQIQEINQIYKTKYRTTLEKDIVDDTSGHFKRLMVSLANGHRNESQAVDQQKAQADAQRLYQAGEKRWGTDESMFNAILCSQSFAQLRAVFDAYSRLTGKTIENSLASEMSGDLLQGMVSVVKAVKDRSAYFAEQMYTSMKGLGTNDRALIRLVVTRCEVDMVQIKEAFMRQYHKTLESFIKDDCSGHYKRILLALVGGKY